MKIKTKNQIKKIVIANILGLYSPMLTGCSQTGINNITGIVPKAFIKPWSKIKSSVKNVFNKVRVTDTHDRIIVQYRIVNDKLEAYRLFAPTSGSIYDPALWEKERTNLDTHQRYFDLFAKIIPREFRKGIRYVSIFDVKDSDLYAGMGDKLKVFQLFLSFDLFDDVKSCYSTSNVFLYYPYIIWIMLHEFGHYLIDSQIKKTYRFGHDLPEGQKFFLKDIPVYKNESLMRQLKLLYWCRGEPFDLLDRINHQPEACKDNYQKMAAYREKRIAQLLEDGAFITEYASTSYDEDAAETFAYFVLLDQRPEPSNILNDKVLLFWKDPKMVKIRAAIRNNLEKLDIRPNMSRDDLRKIDVYPSTSDIN